MTVEEAREWEPKTCPFCGAEVEKRNGKYYCPKCGAWGEWTRDATDKKVILLWVSTYCQTIRVSILNYDLNCT